MSDRGGDQVVPRPTDWKRGADPTWPVPSDRRYLVDDVGHALAEHTPSEVVRGSELNLPEADRPRSAVLVALYDGVEGATTILTKRPAHMRKHAGEIAFPGGAIDDTDASPWAAALREAHEEVNLDPELPQPLGELNRFVTGASYSLVTPFVARLGGPPDVHPSPDEVESILHVPLHELMAPGVYREELWMFEDAYRSIHFFELVGETVWGATAFMLRQLLEVVTERA